MLDLIFGMMKLKNGFPGKLRFKFCAGGFWEEYKYALVLLLAALVLLVCSVLGYGQGRKVVPADTVAAAGTGRTLDLIPGLIVVNGDRPVLRLADFKDRLLILDFWATYCGPCLKLLPRLDSLQRRYGDRLQILLVTREKAAAARAFLGRLGYGLPCVAEDTLLGRWFPHNSIPHEVWIWRGKVLAVTGGEEVSDSVVERVLSGAPVALSAKLNTPFDEGRPLYADGNGRMQAVPGGDRGPDGAILCQSLLTRYNPGLNTVAGIDRSGPYLNVFALNASVISLYHLAFREEDPLLDLPNRFLLEVPDSLREALGDRPLVDRAWEQRYGLCYNLALPAGFKGELGPFLVNDLNRLLGAHLGVQAVLDRRLTDCLVLSRLPGRVLPVVGRDTVVPVFRSDTALTELRGLPLSQLLLRLAYLYRKSALPLVDGTGFGGAVAVRLVGNIADRAVLDKGLAQNGLQLVRERRWLPMVVIRPVGVGVMPIGSTSLNLKP
jgi:thiol-disulfide isomerase/thioredoxin